MDEIELLTPAEVAEILKVQPRSVVAWLQKGKLTGIKLGQGSRAQWRVRKQDLEAFINESTSPKRN